MSVNDEAQKLFQLAERELLRMEAVHDNEDLDDEAYGFFAQQAVEKALKAVLTVQGINFPYTHDLVRLFDLLPAGDARFAYRSNLAILFPYAVELRYDFPQESPVLDRDVTLTAVKEFLALVKPEIP
jgi:HEPN domain-containing protein